MAINNSVDDYQQLNDAGTQGDWTGGTNGDTVDFDAPQLNDTNSTTPIYVESSTCMFWPLKSGITGGYTYTNQLPATVDITDKVVCGLIQYPFADIGNIPITALELRISSDTGFTTNYREWDGLAQISAPENVPISGFTPVMGWYSGGTETGTFVATSVDSCGWQATTGATADGKQGGFDHFFAIGYIGAHSQTFTDTFFDDLYDEWYDNNGGGLPGTSDRPVPVISRSGTFFQSNVRFALGDGTSDTANIVVDESDKTIFFNNLETDHSLGYTFFNPSGANTLSLELSAVTHFWNDQGSTTDVFVNPNNADTFKLDGCSFSNGGPIELPSHSTTRWTRNCTFANCGEIDVGDHDFDGNTVSGATDAVLYTLANDRAKNNSYTDCVDAIRVVGAGVDASIDIDGDQFSGNTFDIVWESSAGVLTVNALNGANPSSSRTTGTGSVTIQNAVGITITVIDEAGSPIQNARVRLGTTPDGGELFTGDLTNASGQVTTSFNYTTDQAVNGRVRKSSAPGPYYKSTAITGTITNAGLSLTVQMQDD